MISLLIIGLVISAIIYLIYKQKYEKTDYFKQTKYPFYKIGKDKGHTGEYYIYKSLQSLEGYKKYLFNCYIPKTNGETTEIDVILLHESGIYVFESKNYSGWIFGSEDQKYWTQTLPAGKGFSKKNKFFNPIIQNNIHLKWLSNFLGQNNIPMYSYIVFSDRCKLKNIQCNNTNYYVINRYAVLPTIKYNISISNNTISKQEIDYLYNKLIPLTQVNELQKYMHIENINNKYSSFQDNNSNTYINHCPRCGNKLILRTATKGTKAGQNFWGCSNYPKCKYTKNINH